MKQNQKRTLLYPSSEDRKQAYKSFIAKCTASPNSVNNYTTFTLIDNLIKQYVDANFTSIIDYEDEEYILSIYNKLCEFKSFEIISEANKKKDFNSIGNGQYKNAILTYIKFLNAIELFKNIQPQTCSDHLFTNIIQVPLQQIYFGAPGTGKSYAINKAVGGEENPNVIRTTFHPDSDYSSFVGCYKPIEKENKKQTSIISADDLIEQAKSITGVANQVSFLSEYAESIIPASEAKGITTNKLIWDLFGWHNETYFVSILTTLLEERAKVDDTEITYKFSPQAFTKAYVAAWKEPTRNFYLVIEEINRGNCAQIFGDIFQLLDRDNKTGESSYAISPDNDLQKYLSEAFANTDIEDADIKSGIKMKLPRNLSIYATMNTSDQSLFPIDSAFKRRWDWKYIPINKDEDGHYIECGNECYDWWDFLEKVNPKIESTTGSEDKQLGFWFAKPEGVDGKISAEKFVSKVVFFLWSDVFKDYIMDSNNVFKTADELLKFRQFFDRNGNINLVVLKQFLTALGVQLLQSEEVEIGDIDTFNEEENDSYLNVWRKTLWNEVQAKLNEHGLNFTNTPTTRNTYQMNMGINDVIITGSIAKTKNIAKAGVYIEAKSADTIYPQLLAYKDEIESVLPKLTWQHDNGSYGSIRYTKQFTDLDNKQERDELIEWLVDNMTKTYNVIKPYLAKISNK